MHDQGPRNGSEARRAPDTSTRWPASVAGSLVPRIVAALVALAASGCASLSEVPYVPQPARVTDPQARIEQMLRSSQTPKAVKVEVTDADLTVLYDVGGEATTRVVHFAEIADMKVLKGDSSYFAKLYDKGGGELFSFEDVDRTTVFRFIDAITAKRAQKKP
jgi:hypothetical protein